MKRTLIVLAFVLIAFTGFAADNFNQTVTVDVPVIIDLALTVGGGGITLNTGNSFADATSRYTLSHNNGANIRITAGITPVGDPAGITLTTTVAAPGVGTSAGAVTLINAGTPSGVAQNCVTAIPAGSYTAGYAITYGATVTAAATVGAQAFTITYTALP